MDGLIVSNTTLQRPANMKSVHSSEKGGLSGAPLKDLSTQTVSEFYHLTKGAINKNALVIARAYNRRESIQLPYTASKMSLLSISV